METVLTILNVIWNIFVFCSVCFTLLFLWGFYRNFKRVNQLVETSKQVAETLESVKLVYVETIDGTMYMYDALTRAFICQGTTEDELWDCVKAKFPNHNVLLTEEPKVEG